MESILMKRRTTTPSSACVSQSNSESSLGRRDEFHAVTVVVTDNLGHHCHRASSNVNDPSDPYRQNGTLPLHPHAAKTSESWMARVSSAMSKRIFPKKHGNANRSSHSTKNSHGNSVHSSNSQTSLHSLSRNTQVVPMMATGPIESAGSTASDLIQSSSSSSIGSEWTNSKKVSLHTSCESSHPKDESSVGPPARHGHGHLERRDTPRNPKVLHQDTIKPLDHSSPSRANANVSPNASRPSVSPTKQSAGSSEYPGDEADSNAIILVNAAPILKDFFNRQPGAAHGIRAQQRENRRMMLYQDTKKRQNALREKHQQEQQPQQHNDRAVASGDLESEADLKVIKKQEIKRRIQEQAQQRRQEVSTAKAILKQVVRSEEIVFQQEREQWESQFDGEIRKLTEAFHKARLRKQGGTIHPANATALAEDTTFGEVRPVTVGGLVVPEAMSEIARDANGFEKRVQSASPRSSTSRPPTIFAGKDEFDKSTNGSDAGILNASATLHESELHEFDMDSNEMKDLFGGFLSN